jgi:hypothetical protein
MDQAPAFMFCPRCGKQNGVSRNDCWSCGLGFHASMKPGAEALDELEYEEDLDNLEYFPTPAQTSASTEDTVKQVPPVGEETVLKGAASAGPYVKFRCTTCRKKFSVVQSRLCGIKKCPACGVRPFAHEPA